MTKEMFEENWVWANTARWSWPNEPWKVLSNIRLMWKIDGVRVEFK